MSGPKFSYKQGCQLKSLFCRAPFEGFRHFFSCKFLVVYVSRTKRANCPNTTRRAPCGWKPYVRRGAARCHEGIVCDTAVTTSVPCRLRYDASHLGFGGPEPFLRPRTLPLSATRKPMVGFWRSALQHARRPDSWSLKTKKSYKCLVNLFN
jgi:hypothetical protein